MKIDEHAWFHTPSPTLDEKIFEHILAVVLGARGFIDLIRDKTEK